MRVEVALAVLLVGCPGRGVAPGSGEVAAGHQDGLKGGSARGLAPAEDDATPPAAPWVDGGNGPAWTLERGPSPRDGLGPGGWLSRSPGLVLPPTLAGVSAGVELAEFEWTSLPGDCAADGPPMGPERGWILVDLKRAPAGCGEAELLALGAELRGNWVPESPRLWLAGAERLSLRARLLGPWDLVSVDDDRTDGTRARLRDRLLRSLGKRPVREFSPSTALEHAISGGNFDLTAEPDAAEAGAVAALVDAGLLRVERSPVGLLLDLDRWAEGDLPASWVEAARTLESRLIPYGVIPWWSAEPNWSGAVHERLARTRWLVVPEEQPLAPAVASATADWNGSGERAVVHMGEDGAMELLPDGVAASIGSRVWSHVDTARGIETLHVLSTRGDAVGAPGKWSARRARVGPWRAVRLGGSGGVVGVETFAEAPGAAPSSTPLGWVGLIRREGVEASAPERLQLAGGGHDLLLVRPSGAAFATLSLPEHWTFHGAGAPEGDVVEGREWRVAASGDSAAFRVETRRAVAGGGVRAAGRRVEFELTLENPGSTPLPASTAKLCLNPEPSNMFAFDEHELTYVREGDAWRPLAEEWSRAGSGTYLEVELEEPSPLVAVALDRSVCLAFEQRQGVRVGGNGNGPWVCLHHVVGFPPLAVGQTVSRRGSVQLLDGEACARRLR